MSNDRLCKKLQAKSVECWGEPCAGRGKGIGVGVSLLNVRMDFERRG